MTQGKEHCPHVITQEGWVNVSSNHDDLGINSKAKQSRYTSWWRLGEKEV
jgi:hypothetical protein